MNPSRHFVVNAPTTCFTDPSAAAISQREVVGAIAEFFLSEN